MMYGLLMIALFQGPVVEPAADPVFTEPPEEAPAFQDWARQWPPETNVGEPRRSVPVPATIGIREVFDRRGVCPADESVCNVTLTYEFTFNAENLEDTTVAVIRYIIAGPSGQTEGCAWINTADKSRRYFVVYRGGWTELVSGEEERNVEIAQIDSLLLMVKRRIRAREQEEPQ